jgi:hypothetical protein
MPSRTAAGSHAGSATSERGIVWIAASARPGSHVAVTPVAGMRYFGGFFSPAVTASARRFSGGASGHTTCGVNAQGGL